MTGVFAAVVIIFVVYGLSWLFGNPPVRVVYGDYIKSAAWRQRARDCKARAGWRCQSCGSRNDLQAHHRTYARLGHERLGDLVCLCDECHRAEHGLRELT